MEGRCSSSQAYFCRGTLLLCLLQATGASGMLLQIPHMQGECTYLALDAWKLANSLHAYSRMMQSSQSSTVDLF